MMRVLLGSRSLDLKGDWLIVRVLQAQALRNFIVEWTSEAQLNGIEFDRHCGVETTEFLSNGKVTLLRWMLSAVVYNS